MPKLLENEYAHCLSIVCFVSLLACIFDVGGLENSLGGCTDPRFSHINCLML